MSRIAGIYHPGSPPQAAELVRHLETKESHGERERVRCAQGPAAFSWNGRVQPQCWSGEDLLLVVDGTIFNREELGSAQPDAELIRALYRKHGFIETLKKVNGDIAIALFDRQAQQLWLGRDRIGIKPLYYTVTSDYFAFASTPGILRNLPGVDAAVDEQYAALFAASHYRYFDNRPHRSPFKSIRQLPAAQALCCTAGQTETFQYWTLTDKDDLPGAADALAEQYRALLQDAVAIRLQAVARPAFTLSGGMDSSSVLASAVKTTGRKQHAVSTVYTDKTFDESEDIQSMLATHVEQWHPVHIASPDLFDTVAEMITVHEEPVATATWLSHYLLSRYVKASGFDGLFGGLGGDELNAGEYEYFFYHFADMKHQGQDRQLENEIEKWILYHDHPIHRKSAALVTTTLAQVTDPSKPGCCRPDRQRFQRYAHTLNQEYFDLDTFRIAMDHPFGSYLRNRTYQDIFRETAPCCLRAEDRHAEAFGHEHFLPFFDYRLVEFMFRIPGHMKIKDGVTKILLRQAMQGILPEETRTRIKKTGWNAPAHIWFTGPGLAQLKDLVHSRVFRERGIYDFQAVCDIIADHEQIVRNGLPRENHMMFLWQLVNLELWLQQVSG